MEVAADKVILYKTKSKVVPFENNTNWKNLLSLTTLKTEFSFFFFLAHAATRTLRGKRKGWVGSTGWGIFPLFCWSCNLV